MEIKTNIVHFLTCETDYEIKTFCLQFSHNSFSVNFFIFSEQVSDLKNSGKSIRTFITCET
jgi:hypothetical protein